MGRLVCFLLLGGVLVPLRAASLPRTYLTLAGGANVLTGDVSGDVVDERVVGHFELGIGSHLNDNLLLEGSFGVYGDQQGPIVFVFSGEELRLPESARTFRIETNPIMMRLRYARSGMRSGYIKPELQLGFGVFSVTRWLQPLPGFEPDSARDLLLAGEVGLSALFILGKNWMGLGGARYTVTQRHDLVDATRHLDSLAILIGFRFFLESPRDAGAARRLHAVD